MGFLWTVIFTAAAIFVLLLLYLYFRGIQPMWANAVSWFRTKDKNADEHLIHWAAVHDFHLQEGYTLWNIVDRFRASPGKSFFQAERFMMESDMRPVVSGSMQNRQIWVYPIVGKTFPGSRMGFSRPYVTNTNTRYNRFTGQQISQKTETTYRVFSGWCVEISTKRIPQNIILTKKYFAAPDMIDTESRSFEETYDIHGMQDSVVLQLLDPELMQRALDSTAAAIEISDESVILYYTEFNITYDVLEAYLQNGLAIAEQVDRNFPLAK